MHQEAVGSANGIFIKLYRPEFLGMSSATMVWRSTWISFLGCLVPCKFWIILKGFCRTAVIPRDEKEQKRPSGDRKRAEEEWWEPRVLSGRSCTPAMWPRAHPRPLSQLNARHIWTLNGSGFLSLFVNENWQMGWIFAFVLIPDKTEAETSSGGHG